MLTKWKDIYYLESYLLAKDGLPDKVIAERLGVDQFTYARWKKTKPALRQALESARNGPTGKSQKHHVHGRLPPHLQALWDRINRCNDDTLDGIARLESILSDAGTSARQALFLHALCESFYDVSEALRRLNVPKKELDHWIRHDPDFAELVDEVSWHKGNLFEGQFVRLAQEGEPSVVIHAAKTYNRNRGYGEVKTKEVTGKVRHSHEHSGEVSHQHQIGVEDLDLPQEVLELILYKMRVKLGEVKEVEDTTHHELAIEQSGGPEGG